MSDQPLDPREMTPADFARLGIERISRGDAIRAMCLQCMAGSSREVTLCASGGCPLWPFRMGTDPFREKREMTDEQRQAAAERLATGRLRVDHTNGRENSRHDGADGAPATRHTQETP